jgi:16S rRNA (uracil1498-N3)-methyltransferase
MSSLPRLFLPRLSPDVREVLLESRPAHYLLKVLRKKVGDMFIGIDPQGREYDMTLQNGLPAPSAEVVGMRNRKEESSYSIVLAQALPKGSKMDSILRQCTEVGVDRFIPILTRRCVSRPGEDRRSHKVDRWEKILEESCRQSQRVTIPRLDPVTGWSEVLMLFKEFDLVLLPYEEQALSFSDILVARPVLERLLILIGPEGGWDPIEVKEAEDRGALSVHLPTPILRTETAGVAVISMLRFYLDSQGSRIGGEIP